MAELTPEERSAAVAELEASRRRLLAALDGLTGDQWSQRPGPDRWSIAECAEHVAAAELPLARLFASGVRIEPSEEERREIRGKDDFVRTFLRDRSQRGEAPERIRPKGRFATREETIRVLGGAGRLSPLLREPPAAPLHRWGRPPPGAAASYACVVLFPARTDRHPPDPAERRREGGFVFRVFGVDPGLGPKTLDFETSHPTGVTAAWSSSAVRMR